MEQQSSPLTTAPAANMVAPGPLPIEKANSPSRVLIVIVGILVLIVGSVVAWYFFLPSTVASRTLPTYFNYSANELAVLQELSSSQIITVEDLYRLDRAAFDVVTQGTAQGMGGIPSKLYAYLAVAQRDFAFLSYNLTDSFAGTIDPLSRDVICAFFPEQCTVVTVQKTDDPYSKAIAALVMAKVRARMAEDEAGLKDYPIPTGKEYWDGPQPSVGISAGSSKGWFITSGSQFRPARPPTFDSQEFKDEQQKTILALKNATPQQKRATVFWAGGPGTKTPPGQILELGSSYMQEHNVSLEKTLVVRSVLTMAVADAETAVFDSKYTYFVRRPFMMDSSIITIMPTPNHPSYAAGHSTLSTAGATILKHYFPEASQMWDEKAYEAGMSRIWGGIHYMMDHEAGSIIGEKVGQAAVQGTVWSEVVSP